MLQCISQHTYNSSYSKSLQNMRFEKKIKEKA